MKAAPLILAVDRNRRNLELLGQFLGKEGYQLLTASTPDEFEAQRLVLHKEAAEVLGVEWDEYCEMNNLVV